MAREYATTSALTHVLYLTTLEKVVWGQMCLADEKNTHLTYKPSASVNRNEFDRIVITFRDAGMLQLGKDHASKKRNWQVAIDTRCYLVVDIEKREVVSTEQPYLNLIKKIQRGEFVPHHGSGDRQRCKEWVTENNPGEMVNPTTVIRKFWRYIPGGRNDGWGILYIHVENGVGRVLLSVPGLESKKFTRSTRNPIRKHDVVIANPSRSGAETHGPRLPVGGPPDSVQEPVSEPPSAITSGPFEEMTIPQLLEWLKLKDAELQQAKSILRERYLREIATVTNEIDQHEQSVQVKRTEREELQRTLAELE